MLLRAVLASRVIDIDAVIAGIDGSRGKYNLRNCDLRAVKSTGIVLVSRVLDIIRNDNRSEVSRHGMRRLG